jgi:hypothetical protein
MSNLQIQPIIIDGQAIHWEVVSGRAVGVQKYTKIIPNRKAPPSSEILQPEMSERISQLKY